MLLKNEIWRALCALLCSSLLGVGCLSPLVPFAPIAAQDDVLQLNQIQILASHNSYRLHTNDTVFATLQDLYAQGLLPDNLSPHGLDYTHLSFPDQMNDYPIRGLEIDIYNDPQGGAFANRKMNEFWPGRFLRA